MAFTLPFALARESPYRTSRVLSSLPHRLFAGAVALATITPGCGASQTAPNSIQVAGQRLQGRWRLASFVPETQLEAPLQSLLNAELGQLAVTFTGTDYSAVGPGINVSGRLQIESAVSDQLTGSLFDATGVGYRVSGQFEGPSFRFRAFDAPWRGTGTLVR